MTGDNMYKISELDTYLFNEGLMEEAYKNNPSLRFFIDLHRDSGSHEKTTTNIDGKNYAKILFVVGLEHDNYEKNLNLAEKLNNILKKYNEKLSRGILKKKGPGVNGIYNQDFSPEATLIEVGGEYNTIDEVNNTLKIIAEVIRDYLGEEKV